MQRLLFALLFLNCELSCSQAIGKQAINTPVNGYSFFWDDEFSGRERNTFQWNYRGLEKRGDTVNTKRAVRSDGKGHLVIEAFIKGDLRFTEMILTENTFKVRNGYFECKTKQTKIKGIGPAFWVPSSTNTDCENPHDKGTEKDIFEYFHNEGKDSVNHALNRGAYSATHKVAGPVRSALIKADAAGFHTFVLEWTSTSYTTFVHGVKTYTHQDSDLISNVPQFLILSLHIDKLSAGPLSCRELPDQFIVDYVGVYKKATNYNSISYHAIF